MSYEKKEIDQYTTAKNLIKSAKIAERDEERVWPYYSLLVELVTLPVADDLWRKAGLSNY